MGWEGEGKGGFSTNHMFAYQQGSGVLQKKTLVHFLSKKKCVGAKALILLCVW